MHKRSKLTELPAGDSEEMHVITALLWSTQTWHLGVCASTTRISHTDFFWQHAKKLSKMYEVQELGGQSLSLPVLDESWKLTNLSRALQNGRPGPPNPLPADDVSGDVHLCVHEASLLQGYVVIQVRFDGGTLLGHDLGLDGSNFLHWHGFWQGSDQNKKMFWWVETSGCKLLKTNQVVENKSLQTWSGQSAQCPLCGLPNERPGAPYPDALVLHPENDGSVRAVTNSLTQIHSALESLVLLFR